MKFTFPCEAFPDYFHFGFAADSQVTFKKQTNKQKCESL